MNAAQLKASILQQAIEGQLVPQLPEEGVVEQIGPAPSEVPFEIPEPWKWISAKNVFELISGRDLEKKDISESLTNASQIPYITGASQIINEEIVVNRWTSVASVYSYLDDLLLTCKGTVGKTAINKIGNIHIARQIMALRPNKETVILEYLKIYIDFISKQLSNEAKSMIPGISRPTILNRFIPIPPLEEQKRIVAKIEELMPLVEEYGKAYDKLQELNDELPGKLKASILQEAIQGKLVPQLPDDGVVEQIGHAPEEVPFELPASWCWSVLKDIADVKGGKRVPAGKKLVPHDTGYPYIRVSDMQNGSVNLDSILYLTEETRLQIKNYTISCKDVYVTVAGTIGRVGTVPKELDGANLTENADKIVLNNNGLLRDWVLCFLKSEFCQQEFKAKTTKVGQPKLAIKRIENICIPIPPLAEQKRIVAKVEALFEQIDLMTK